MDMANTNGWAPLHVAARKGRDAVVAVLLAAGAAVDQTDMKNGWTPLQAAAGNGHEAVVRALLGAGAALNHVMRCNLKRRHPVSQRL